MTVVTTPCYGIRDLKQKKYLPLGYDAMFRDQGMAEANFEEFQVDITTLRPSSHPLHEAQKYHFAMITYLASADDSLKRYCQAALDLTEAEWDVYVENNTLIQPTSKAVTVFHAVRAALFFDEY